MFLVVTILAGWTTAPKEAATSNIRDVDTTSTLLADALLEFDSALSLHTKSEDSKGRGFLEQRH